MRISDWSSDVCSSDLLQAGSNLGKGQVKAADYYLQPDIVSSNKNSGGNALGGMLGGFLGGRTIGALAGGISIKKSEANVTLSIVNTRTTEEEALTEGYARKRSEEHTSKLQSLMRISYAVFCWKK